MNTYLFNSAIQYLSRRPRSTKEVKDYLLKKLDRRPIRRRNGTVYTPPKPTLEKEAYLNELKEKRKGEIEEILLKLTELKFLNDIEYAKWFVESRSRSNPKGWRLIELELGQKGISKEMIQDLRFKIYEDKEQVDDDLVRDERALALGIAQKKVKQLAGLDKQVIYRRLGGLLGRRGFDMDIIRSVIDEVLKKSV